MNKEKLVGDAINDYSLDIGCMCRLHKMYFKIRKDLFTSFALGSLSNSKLQLKTGLCWCNVICLELVF